MAWVLKLNVFNRVVLGWMLFWAGSVAAVCLGFLRLPVDVRTEVSAATGNFLLILIIVWFISWGLWKELMFTKFLLSKVPKKDLKLR